MRRISIVLPLMLAIFSSCQRQNVRMQTVVHADGTCEREVSYSNVVTQRERDSLSIGDSSRWSLPLPETLLVDSSMSVHTVIGGGDTVITTFRAIYRSAEEMSQKMPLQLNGVRLRSNAKLNKRFLWFYTEYTFTETFACVGDSFKLSPLKYADKDIVNYWFTGRPDIMKGLSGAETMSKLYEIQPLIDKWLSDNLVGLCFDYIANHYDSIRNPPVSRQQFVEQKDSLVKLMTNNKHDILDIRPDEAFRDYFRSDAYSMFFDEENEMGKALNHAITDRLTVLSFEVPYALIMPGKVVDSGIGILQNGVIRYPLTGERLIPHDYIITAKSRVTNVWACVLTLIVLLLAVGFYLRSRRRHTVLPPNL